MSVHSERGLLFDLEDEHLGLPGDLGCLIKTMKWMEFNKEKYPYNIQLVKEFCTNLINITSKKVEVRVRGVKVSYSGAKLNLVFGLNIIEDTIRT